MTKLEWMPRVEEPRKKLRTRPETMAALFHEIAATESDEAKIELFQQFRHPALDTILRYILDPAIHFNVRVANYSACRYAEADSLWQAARKLYLFCNDPIKTSPLADNPAKQQVHFSDFLSSIQPQEITILRCVVEKRLPDGLTAEIVFSAFPNLLSDKADEARRSATKNHELELALAESRASQARRETREQMARTLEGISRASVEIEQEAKLAKFKLEHLR